MLKHQQFESGGDFSTRSFDMLENVGMTSAERGDFSTALHAHSNEASVENHPLKRFHSLTHVDQEDTASVSGISELFKVMEEPRAQILKHDVEIPPQARIATIPLSSFPLKLQQLMSARAENIFELRQAAEIPAVTYVWPVIRMKDASSPIWNNFPKYLIPMSPILTGHCSSPDVMIEDVICSHITPVSQLKQEELDGRTARSYPLLVKSCSSVVSEILKSLTNTKNKDYKDTYIVPPLSECPPEEQLENPLFKDNALVICNGKVYLLYVMRHEALPAETEVHGCDMLLKKTTAWLITCSIIRDVTTEVPHSLLLGQYNIKQKERCLTTFATSPNQDKTSNATHFPSHGMTTISQPNQSSPSTGKRQQFLSKTAFLSEESLQKRDGKEALQEKDNELRRKFGIVKDVRVLLNRLNPSELKENSSKASALKWKLTMKKLESVAKVLSCSYINRKHASP
ncbi:ligand-dependent nuclear receptor-interacting factor 1-like [Neopsephotus bourkii]|uniref:ligand-dependent nuclear receptor-interacting factor 1-like n=1 Tax=Neopsephotus bourkii TaxID=309878 RepID=UPI002AA55A8C|nr:ligand-dependent nuclear receptor-interacting factor 1-like [Neopsephotus bourkii]